MAKERILVTGVAGFIGSAIAEKLLDLEYEVFGIDDLSSGDQSRIPKDINFIEADLSKVSSLEKIPAKVKYVMHLSGQSSGEMSFENPILDLQKNTHSTLNLISHIKKNDIESISYASSMSVYGEVENTPINEHYPTKPLSCYGVGKLASENYLRIMLPKKNVTIMRMFNVYGPGQDLKNLKQGMVSIYLSQALNSNKIYVKGSIERWRDFIYVDDVVDAWIKAINLKGHNIFNLGSGKKTLVKELLDEIKKNFPLSEIFISNPTIGDQFGIYSDNSKIKEKLKISKFTSLAEGVKKFAEWSA